MKFQIDGPKQMIYGEQSFNQLSVQLQLLNVQAPFILYSESALNSGKKMVLKEQLEQSNCQATFLEMPKGEPTLRLLKQFTQIVDTKECDSVVAIGGGSVLDLAKAIAVMACNNAIEFKEIGNMGHLERLPFIAVPTTAGTGSEATKVAVLTDSTLNVKFNPKHIVFLPDVAILDPALTVGVSSYITAITGIDALTHAIEAYISTVANDVSDFYAKQAIKLITQSLETVYEDPMNIEARGKMLLGSYYAGLAFSNASTNLAHALGRAIGTKWHLPHGLSVAILHPFVVEFSLASSKERYEDIAQIIGLSNAYSLATYLKDLNSKMDIWEKVDPLIGVEYLESINEMTKNALSGNGIVTNRQIPDEHDVEEIYKQFHSFIQQRKQMIES